MFSGCPLITHLEIPLYIYIYFFFGLSFLDANTNLLYIRPPYNQNVYLSIKIKRTIFVLFSSFQIGYLLNKYLSNTYLLCLAARTLQGQLSLPRGSQQSQKNSVLLSLTLFQATLNLAKPHTSKRNEYGTSMGIQAYFFFHPIKRRKSFQSYIKKESPIISQHVHPLTATQNKLICNCNYTK